MNKAVARALDRLATYLGRVRARWEAGDVYQAMADVAELSEIARRMYFTLGEAARSFRPANPSKNPAKPDTER